MIWAHLLQNEVSTLNKKLVFFKIEVRGRVPKHFKVLMARKGF